LCVLNLKNIASFPQNITPAVKYLLVGLMFVAVSSFHSKKHPYYIGLTEITFNAKTAVQVSVRLFTSDLEDALRKNSGKSIDLLNPKNKAETDSLLFQYISKRLAITVNAKLQALSFVGYEKEEESIWTYMELKNTKPVVVKTLVVDNKILYDHFPAQTHIIRVNRFDVNSSKKITNPESRAEFSF
jgi:hypothetical protein